MATASPAMTWRHHPRIWNSPGVIIPSKTVARLREIAKGFGDGALTIELSESKIRVTAGDVVLSSKLIDGTYPDYARVIPTGNDKLARTRPRRASPAPSTAYRPSPASVAARSR
jgi:DNA polymerase III sliding clamp (beta) subunit (PCNA family)